MIRDREIQRDRDVWAALTPLCRRVLLAMLKLEGPTPVPPTTPWWAHRWAHSPNEIGAEVGVARVEGSGRGNGRGSGHRVFGSAQRVISPITALDRRGLIHPAPRPDGLSGIAYALTEDGRRILRNRPRSEHDGE